MNEKVLTTLKVIVERAVRPVHAPAPRKTMMREELLAHVAAIFEEELREHGDEQLAAANVERRFGDPNELAGNLQRSVFLSERIVFFAERWFEARVGESLIRRAGRYGLTIFAVFATGWNVLCPLLVSHRQPAEEPGAMFYTLTLSAAMLAVMTFLLTLLTVGLQRTWRCAWDRSWFKSSLILLISCVVPTLMRVLFAVGMHLYSSGDLLIKSYSFGGTIAEAVTFQIIVIVAAIYLPFETKHVDEWGKLQID